MTILSTGRPVPPRTASDVVLSARNLSVVYDGDRPTRAVRDVSLDLRRGEILGIAGESGCGKSTLAYALTSMLRSPARLDGGSVHFTGRDGGTVDLTALDVVVQREILDEVMRLQEERGFSVVFITHDLSLLLEISDRIAVMYAGEIAEIGPAEELGTAPAHPYALGLLRSFPDVRAARRDLRGIPGSPPDLRKPVAGCAFAPRCEYAWDSCRSTVPRLLTIGQADDERRSHLSRCLLHDPAVHPGGAPPELSGRTAPDGPGRTEGPGRADGPDRPDASDKTTEEIR